MSALTLVMTNAGMAAFTAAQLAGAPALAIARVGFTDAVFVVAPTLTALPGELRRVDTLSGLAVGDNTVHMIVRDEVAGIAYGARGLALYLTNGTLFAVYSQADRIVEKSAASTLLLAIDIAFPSVAINNLTFGATNFLDPPATITTAGVMAIATQAEVDAGASTGKAVTPSRLASRLAALLGGYIATSLRGAADGVASLGPDSKVPVAQLPAPAVAAIGTITLFYGAPAAVPAGWAICDGSTVAKSDGSGNITLPDLRGRVAVGVDGTRALGDAFGATSVTPATSSGNSGVTLTTTSKTTYAGGGTQTALDSATLTDLGHTHNVTVNVTQPSLALHYIIKV